MAVKTINNIGVISLAKLYGTMTATLGFIGLSIFGFIYGLFFGGIGLMAVMAGGDAAAGIIMMIIGIVILIVMIIVATLAYGIMGFIMGAIIAFVYNLIAGRIGGLQIDLE